MLLRSTTKLSRQQELGDLALDIHDQSRIRGPNTHLYFFEDYSAQETRKSRTEKKYVRVMV